MRRAHRLRRRNRHQPDRPRAEHRDALAELHAGKLQPVHVHRERLDQRPELGIDVVRQLVQIVRRYRHVFAQPGSSLGRAHETEDHDGENGDEEVIRQVEGELHRMLVRKENECDSRSDQQRQEVDLRREEKEADDRRELREREGV